MRDLILSVFWTNPCLQLQEAVGWTHPELLATQADLEARHGHDRQRIEHGDLGHSTEKGVLFSVEISAACWKRNLLFKDTLGHNIHAVGFLESSGRLRTQMATQAGGSCSSTARPNIPLQTLQSSLEKWQSAIPDACWHLFSLTQAWPNLVTSLATIA